ncbi:MAG: phosphoribosylglycinamide synthetase C domain-containing protein [Candidatus Hinthialibacter sp.]
MLTSGGRVLGVSGLGEDFDEAYENAYEAVNRIHFANTYYRKDIGYRVRSG